jgi:ketosteroid isomerase-like protein
MSNANIALVQNIYAAFGKGDIASLINVLAADVDWGVNGPARAYPTFGIWKGSGEVQKFFKLVAETESFSEFSPREFHAAGDLVFALGSYAGAVKKSGRPFACDWVHVFTIHGGKVTKFREYTDTAQFADAYRG